MGADTVITDDPDPDAPWKPGYAWPAPFDSSVAGTPTSTGPSPSRPADGAPDPWSRAAASRPDAWKDFTPPASWRELGRDRDAAPTAGPVPRAPVAEVEGMPSSTVTGEVVLGAVAVVTLLLVSVVVGRSLPRSEPEPERISSSSMPLRVDALWSVEFDGRVVSTSAAEGVLLVDTGADVFGFDQATGERLWVRGHDAEPLERDLQVIDGTAIVLDRNVGRPLDVVGLDARTGEERWRRSDAPGDVLIIDRWLIELSARRRSLQTVDPRTGEATGPELGIGPTFAPLPRAAAWDNGRVTLYDLDTAERIGGPVDALNLQSIDLVDETLVGFDDDAKIAVFDDRGTRVDERRFNSDVRGDFTGRAELIGEVPGHGLAIVASGSSMGFTVAGGRVDVVWEREGRVGAPVETEIGPVSVARVIDRTTGEVNLALVDATTGETILVTDAGVTREVDPVPLANGYVVSPEIGAASRELSGHRYDGEVVWALEIPLFALYEVLDGSVLVVERGPERSTVSMFG